MEKKEAQQSTVALTSPTESAQSESSPPSKFGLSHFGIAPLGQGSNSSRPPPLQAFGIAPLGGAPPGSANLSSPGLPSLGISPLGAIRPAPSSGKPAEGIPLPTAPIQSPPPVEEQRVDAFDGASELSCEGSADFANDSAPSAATEQASSPVQTSTNDLASVIERLVAADTAASECMAKSTAKGPTKNAMSFGSLASASSIVSMPLLSDADDDDWDIAASSESSAVLARDDALPRNDPELESPIASQVATVGTRATLTRETREPESRPQLSSDNPPDDASGGKPIATVAAADAKAAADDTLASLPEAMASIMPEATETPGAANVEVPAGVADLVADQDLDEEAELMALIAAAKAKADDVPPPPPPQQLLGEAPSVTPDAATANVAATVGDVDQDADEEAELLALIAAAKAKADDVPPPPPRPLSEAPAGAPDASAGPPGEGSAREADQQTVPDADEEAELLALIAAAKAKPDDVPPPPPPQ